MTLVTHDNPPKVVKIGRKVAYTGAALGKFVAAQTRRHTGEAGG